MTFMQSRYKQVVEIIRESPFTNLACFARKGCLIGRFPGYGFAIDAFNCQPTFTSSKFGDLLQDWIAYDIYLYEHVVKIHATNLDEALLKFH